MMPLSIRSDGCSLDFLALGAMVLRLDPGIVPFRRSHKLEAHVSGGEYNVAANLTSCFDLRAAMATAMVDDTVGELVESQIREMGVTPIFRRYQRDGVRGPNIATVYSDKGHGVRAPVVSYNRANEAGALLRPGDFAWDEIFSRGVRWFHSGGIFASLSRSTGELILEALRVAKKWGAICSFDLNYRPKLWSSLFASDTEGQAIFRNIVRHVDVLFGSERDFELQLGLGRDGEVGRHSTNDPNFAPEQFFETIDKARAKLPGLKCVATTRRHVHSSNRHDWMGLMWLEGERLLTPILELDVVDRIGSGDGFSSGLIYGLLNGRDATEALRLGWAHGALLTTYPGDVSMARLSEVESLAAGATAAVQR